MFLAVVWLAYLGRLQIWVSSKLLVHVCFRRLKSMHVHMHASAHVYSIWYAGFAAEGNEFTWFMLLPTRLLLSSCTEGEHVIHPYATETKNVVGPVSLSFSLSLLHQFSRVASIVFDSCVSFAADVSHQLRPVGVPDVNASSVGYSNISLSSILLFPSLSLLTTLRPGPPASHPYPCCIRSQAGRIAFADTDFG